MLKHVLWQSEIGLKAPEKTIVEFANGKDQNEAAHYEPPHLGLRHLQIQQLSSKKTKEKRSSFCFHLHLHCLFTNL